MIILFVKRQWKEWYLSVAFCNLAEMSYIYIQIEITDENKHDGHVGFSCG